MKAKEIGTFSVKVNKFKMTEVKYDQDLWPKMKYNLLRIIKVPIFIHLFLSCSSTVIVCNLCGRYSQQ